MTVQKSDTRISFNITFDAESDEAIREMWGRIAARDVVVPGLTGYRPHITLAVYDVAEYASFEAAAESALDTAPGFEVRLDSLGLFIDAGVVFLAARISHSMLSLHRNMIHRFREARQPEVIAEFLLPDAWVPHVTLASFSGKDELSRAIEACHAAWNPITAVAEAVTLRVHPSTEDYRLWPLEIEAD
jgi:2'-5' RNA ligase